MAGLKGWLKGQKLSAESTAARGELIVSWNCDGLETDALKWLFAWIQQSKPAVICLNETHLSDQMTLAALEPLANTYHILSNAHDPPRYHGVAMLIRKSADLAFDPIPIDLSQVCAVRSDNKSTDPTKGRFMAVHLKELDVRIVATYVPNSGTSRTNPLRNLDYRINQWDPALAAFLETQRKLGPTLWIGDINVAPADIDVTSPKLMARWAGFTSEERKSLDTLYLQSGEWVDVWRTEYPKWKQYSWHNSSTKHGMRLDNALASKDLSNRCLNPFIGASSATVLSASTASLVPSDHLPIGLTIVRKSAKLT